MTKKQKILLASIWTLSAVLLIVVGAIWLNYRPAHPAAMADSQTNGPAAEHEAPRTPVPDFSFTDQDNKSFTASAMKGHVWIADFIFTQCQGPCPLMTARMAQLQKDLHGQPIRFVSFSVDPANDTPPVLKKYAAEHGADLSNWSFVTGEQDSIFSVAHTLLIGVTAAVGKMPIAHSVRFLLIDASGKVQGYYDGTDPAELKDLARDARKLAGA
jgi:protein SCO1/2